MWKLKKIISVNQKQHNKKECIQYATFQSRGKNLRRRKKYVMDILVKNERNPGERKSICVVIFSHLEKVPNNKECQEGKRTKHRKRNSE